MVGLLIYRVNKAIFADFVPYATAKDCKWDFDTTYAPPNTLLVRSRERGNKAIKAIGEIICGRISLYAPIWTASIYTQTKGTLYGNFPK